MTNSFVISYDHIAKGVKRIYKLRPIGSPSEAASTEANLKLNPDVSNVKVVTL